MSRLESISEQLFLDHLPHIEKVVAHLCRRYHFREEECEEFLSRVQIKIMDKDYAVLRQFQGKSSFPTYLAIVITNSMKDYLNHLWGKWRPCAEAERLGPVAVLLDKFMTRDGYSFDEATQILQTNHKVEMSWQELYPMAARLPDRSPRRMEGEEGLRDFASSEACADHQLAKQESEASRCRALKTLQQVRETLSKEDQLILKMQERGFSVADISRSLSLDQKQLYRRIQKIYKDLRAELERRGIRKDSIEDLFDD